MAANGRRAVLQRAVEAVAGGDVAALPELFTDDVTGWSPNMLVTSLGELTEVVGEREDALSDLRVEVDAADIAGGKGFAEFRISAVFSGPFAIDEDTVIEPNGREIVLGGALVTEFDGDKVSAFRAYFDDFSLLYQLVAE